MLASDADGDGLAGSSPGRLFVVGDPKQSIYRFRRADMAVYDAPSAGALGGRRALPALTAEPPLADR